MNNNTLSSEKIIIIDNVIIGNNHLVFNSGIINMSQGLFEKDIINKEIMFFGDSLHTSILENLIDINDTCKVSFFSVDIINPKIGILQNTLSWFKKFLKDKKNLEEILEINSFQEPKLIIVSNLMPINLVTFINIINKKFNQKVLIFIHGELELLFKHKLSLKEKINKYFLEKFFRNICCETKLIVFSDFIKSALTEKFGFNEYQVMSINHPILKYERKTTEISNCIVFSHLGVANKRKNSGLIFKLANAFEENIKKDKCKFSIIGRIDDRKMNFISGNVIVESEENKPIPNDRYIELVSNSDYSLIFLLDDEYVYRMSGSLLDSIQFQIPIIALKHIFVLELFDKGGDIGFLCNDFEEMKEVVNQIVLKNPKFVDRYRSQVSNLKSLAENFYPEHAAAIINKEIDI